MNTAQTKLAAHPATIEATRREATEEECEKMFVHYATEFFRNEMARIRTTLESGGTEDMVRLMPYAPHDLKTIENMKIWGKKWDRTQRPMWWERFDVAKRAVDEKLAELERAKAAAEPEIAG